MKKNQEEKQKKTYDWTVDINYEIFQFRHSTKEGEPERNLYLAVILQALLDATHSTVGYTVAVSGSIQSQADSWFFTSVSAHATDFNYVCDMAGLDPSYTRSFAYKIIRSKEISFIRKRINGLLS